MEPEYCHNTDEILRSYIEQKINFLDNPSFAYSLISKKNLSEIYIISNYHQEWVKKYLENKLQYIDPVVILALRRYTPFPWNKDITVFSDIKSSKIFSLSKKYNIYS